MKTVNHRFAALALVAIASLGLVACSGSPSAPQDPGANAPAVETTAPAESIADACIEPLSALANASAELATASAAALAQSETTDPQAAVNAFTAAVDALSATAASASNTEVKSALTAVSEDLGSLNDLLSKMLIDKDLSVAGAFATAASDAQTSITALQTLCAG